MATHPGLYGTAGFILTVKIGCGSSSFSAGNQVPSIKATGRRISNSSLSIFHLPKRLTREDDSSDRVETFSTSPSL
jgi:hypothetical protein